MSPFLVESKMASGSGNLFSNDRVINIEIRFAIYLANLFQLSSDRVDSSWVSHAVFLPKEELPYVFHNVKRATY